MLFYVNERYLLQGQRLKVLLFAPEMGAVAPRTGVVPPDLHVRFTLSNEEEQPANVEFTRPVEGQGFLHFRIPFSYAEASTDKLAPGSYVVQAQDHSEVIERVPLMVLDAKQYEAIARMVSAERTRGDATRFTSSDQVVQAWFQSWTELYSYLGVVIPQHVIASTAPSAPASRPFEFSGALLARLTSESFRWVSFHLNRFVFDQLFYGGVVGLQRVPAGSELQWRLNLQYRVKPQAGREGEDLDLLRSMLKDARFSIDLAWNAVPPAQPFVHQSQLDVTWRMAQLG